MNTTAERITFKGVHRFPCWPLCIRPFLKGLSWKIKSVIFFFPMDPQSRNRCDISNLYFVHTLEKNDTDQSRGSGSMPETRTIGAEASNDMVHLRSLLCACVEHAGGGRGLCLLTGSINEVSAKGCHFPLPCLFFPSSESPYNCR